MRVLSITGANGFVGKNLIQYFINNPSYKILPIDLRSDYGIAQIQESDTVIHLAGKAHDLKKTSTPDEYYHVNTELTKKVFDQFLVSSARVFIMMSSVKAAADQVEGKLYEDHEPNPQTHYGKSKLLAEKYILEKNIPLGKKVFILRPCMIHGPGNKGNLNLLYQMAKKKIPWPLGSFHNQRSFLSIENLCFVIQQLIENESIKSGIYQVSDDEPISTNELLDIICSELGYKSKILYLPKWLIQSVATIGGLFHLPLNNERLKKLTESYLVSNQKIVDAVKQKLPVNARVGLSRTIRSFLYD